MLGEPVVKIEAAEIVGAPHERVIAPAVAAIEPATS
jgi:hypothetical protein